MKPEHLRVEDVTSEWLTSVLALDRPGTVVKSLEIVDVLWGASGKVRVRACRQVDLVDNLIDLSAGRIHPRKRRPIVPIADHVRPWIVGIKGKLIRYRVPIAERHRTPGGPPHFERVTSSVWTTWRAVCREAGIEGATPKMLRRTMLTWLARRGVPQEQRAMLAGHGPKGTTARNYEHLSPDYLQAAIREIDASFEELAKHIKVPSRYRCDTQAAGRVAA